MAVSHTFQTEIFQRAFAQNKMHHAWLLAGPQGIGKASWARAQAAKLLDVPVEHIAYHTHFLALGSEEEPLAIDQLRDARPFFSYLPVEDKPKIVLIDTIDGVNEKATNALLKILEEPPEKTIFMLVTHHPHALLPTIRSRAIVLRFQPFGFDETKAIVLSAKPDLDMNHYNQAAALYPGQPGMILSFIENAYAELIPRFMEALSGGTIVELDKEKETKNLFYVLAKLIHQVRIKDAVSEGKNLTEKMCRTSEMRIISDCFLYNLDKKTTMNMLIKNH